MKIVLLPKSTFFLFIFCALGIPVYAQNDRNDHQAEIIRLQGQAKLFKKQTNDWQEAAKGMKVEAGDQILTESNSTVEIGYDARLRNVGHISQNTKAEFVSIEPTRIQLLDGAIFNVLDASGSTRYEVATPTAVAAVRGTHFDVRYNSRQQLMDVCVFKDRKSGKSRVEIIPLDKTFKSFFLTEGNQAEFGLQDFQSGQIDTNPAPEDRTQNAESVMAGVSELREEAGSETSSSQSGSRSSSDETASQTQGEFALMLVKEIGALKRLPPAADGKDAIEFLTRLGIVPEGGWDEDAEVTDDFLRSFFGEEGQGLSRAELIQKIRELLESRFDEKETGVFRVQSASGSSPA